jgi:small subunit ribosomal protein S4
MFNHNENRFQNMRRYSKYMAKFTGPKGKIVRRFGVNIYGSPKYDQLLERRSHGPGQHGPNSGRRKISDYALQLIEKQKLRHSYGLLEKPFRRTFRRAQQMPGVTGDNLLTLLETRLDSLVWRAGFGRTMMQSRQLINHGHLLVNERRVNIASYQVKPGDRITLRDRDRTRALVTRGLTDTPNFSRAEWFTVDESSLAVSVNRLPQRDEINSMADDKMIIEFYSK